MSLHADAVRVLSGWPAPTDEQDGLRRTYLSLLHTRPDAMTRDCLPEHLTASALVLSADRSSVLLTLHTRIGRWLQTGGHCEDADTSLAGAALRESQEETGIAGLTIDPVPVLLSRHQAPCGPDGSAHHLDVQYAVVAPAGARETRSAESDDLRWFGLDALPGDADSSVRALVHAATKRPGSPVVVDEVR